MQFQHLQFKNINLADPFFNSLKNSYAEFSDWFARKCNESAYVFFDEQNHIQGFLYLKIEDGLVDDVYPPLPHARRLKIGTLKIDAHGTRMGERFVKKSIDYALYSGVQEIYVTIFEEHASLVNLLQRYGFQERAKKETVNGNELVLVKNLRYAVGDVTKDYPLVYRNSRKFILSLRPEWHSRLLPDSILNNENPERVIQDISHTNSIHKVYLTNMGGTEQLVRGDTLVIYRTSDGQGPARYRSVATSLCVVEEVRNINSFASEADFLKYASSYSIFTPQELQGFYRYKKYPTIIKFAYNAALQKRVTRGVMLDDLGMDRGQYWGFFQMTDQDFFGILQKGETNESVIVY